MAANLEITVFALFIAAVTAGPTCQDKDTYVCKILAKSNPDLCADSCLSSLCTRFCGKCPLECYTCHEIENPINCTTLTICPSSDHYCYTTQTFNDKFEEVYKLGCATKDLCEINIANGASGKRSDLSVKGSCCTNDRCNNNLPTVLDLMPQRTTVGILNSTAWPVTYTDCNNMDDDVCLKLSLIDPLLCSNDCIANRICPRMCRKCFQCYNCNDLDRPEQCNATITCQSGKECFQLETLSVDLRPVYRLGCLDQSLCQRFQVSPVNSIFGRRQQSLSLKGGCCTADLCNKNIQRYIQAITTTTTHAPTTTTHRPQPTTTQIDCTHHTTDRHCPPGYTYTVREHSCYLVGDALGTWQEGENYCKHRCGYLADFSTSTEFLDVISHLSSKHQATDLWIGATEVSRSNWVWTSTHRPLDQSLTRYLSRIHVSSGGCAAARGSQHIIFPHSCNQHFYPLCEAHRT